MRAGPPQHALGHFPGSDRAAARPTPSSISGKVGRVRCSVWLTRESGFVAPPIVALPLLVRFPQPRPQRTHPSNATYNGKGTLPLPLPHPQPRNSTTPASRDDDGCWVSRAPGGRNHGRDDSRLQQGCHRELKGRRASCCGEGNRASRAADGNPAHEFGVGLHSRPPTTPPTHTMPPQSHSPRSTGLLQMGGAKGLAGLLPPSIAPKRVLHP
jgi:hypothetical protein